MMIMELRRILVRGLHSMGHRIDSLDTRVRSMDKSMSEVVATMRASADASAPCCLQLLAQPAATAASAAQLLAQPAATAASAAQRADTAPIVCSPPMEESTRTATPVQVPPSQ